MGNHTSTSLIPPAKSIINALAELEELCKTLKKKLDDESKGDPASTDLKLIAEYRQLLKLRFEMLRKARTLIDEASFQCAVLDALNQASEDVYNNAIAKLCDLEKEWHGDEGPLEEDDLSEPDEEA